jgi:cyclopropane-fatty-acyl-phospholipid synthase
VNSKMPSIDPQNWPDIARAPKSALRAYVAKKLLTRISAQVPVNVQLPDGSMVRPPVTGNPTMVILSDNFFHRLGADLKIGFGESYMAGEWKPAEGSDLADVLTPFAARLLDIVPAWMRKFRTLLEPRQPADEENNRKGARKNISRHYDLSNKLFTEFLDETMTYSAAWFDGLPVTFENLSQAQQNKVNGILDFAHVSNDSRVLEIGSGWGQLALQAAARGAQVHTITLSQEQLVLAEERFTKAGVRDRINIELRDYRDVHAEYDAVASVEMIEAVGEKYWQEYFSSVSSNLRRGGYFGLQAITMPHDRMLASRHAYSWVHKYIFPGGLIPSVESIEECSAKAGMKVVERRSLRMDYAWTLRLWRQRFNANFATIQNEGFDEVFRKMWEFYLAYSEAGFASGHLDVWQFGIVKS